MGKPAFIALICLALVAMGGAAVAQFNKCGRGFCPGGAFGSGFPSGGGGGVPPATGKIMLVDGVSFLLQVDGASKICRAGGC